MSDRMFFPLSLTDFGTRINLISRVCGLEEAEVFFENIPIDMKVIAVFFENISSLLQHLKDFLIIFHKLEKITFFLVEVIMFRPD